MPDPIVTQAPPTTQQTSPAPDVDIKSSPFAGLDNKIKAAPVVEKAPEKTADTPPDKGVVLDPKTAKDDTAKSPKWYREQQEKFNSESKAANEKIKAMETRLAEAEKRGQDTTALTERLAALERERDDARAETRAAKKEVSPDFKAKWDKPFNQAAEFAKSVVEGMTFTDGENSRPATFDDFTALYQMPINKAAQLARAAFGEDSQLVVQQLVELHRLDRQRSSALDEEKASWKERETTEQAEKVRMNEAYKSMSSYVDKALVEANPDFRDAPGEEGKEAKALREEGYAIFDAKPRTLQEAALKTAEVKHRVAAFVPLQRQRDQLLEKVRQLESTIQEMKDGKPGPTIHKGETAGAPEKTWDAELRDAVPMN